MPQRPSSRFEIGRTLASGKALDFFRPAFYFYHVLESVNTFLERMLDLATAPLDSPKVQALLLSRSGPGGLHCERFARVSQLTIRATR